MSRGDLRRFIVNLLLSDPGALPKHLATTTGAAEIPAAPSSAPSGLPPAPHTNREVPVWDAALNAWVSSVNHDVLVGNLLVSGGDPHHDIRAFGAVNGAD